jgi:hypothetical protein
MGAVAAGSVATGEYVVGVGVAAVADELGSLVVGAVAVGALVLASVEPRVSGIVLPEVADWSECVAEPPSPISSAVSPFALLPDTRKVSGPIPAF